ncbi:MAG: hypothetical protein LKI39_01950 [Bacteroides sp.]|nr:hypothetical protein [Bacteroides sp.]
MNNNIPEMSFSRQAYLAISPYPPHRCCIVVSFSKHICSAISLRKQSLDRSGRLTLGLLYSFSISNLLEIEDQRAGDRELTCGI